MKEKEREKARANKCYRVACAQSISVCKGEMFAVL